eukprot:TRINITY_DN3773_c0_g1_i2.p1 TRINITY_DN3773_c0_g1~~TRINITY_DN3773_c0_g1_i2.p1  ORF type:complete len:195 (+),score=24.41 TRINITY_DN3773_c0_g1_i2:74-658(+)
MCIRDRIRTHAQKFFGKVAKVAPAHKDLLNFVRESPLQYFIAMSDDVSSQSLKSSHKEESKGRSRKGKKFKWRKCEREIGIEDSGKEVESRKMLTQAEGKTGFYPINGFPIQAIRLLSVNGNLGITELNLQNIIRAAIINAEVTQSKLKNASSSSHWLYLYQTGTQIAKLLQSLKNLHYGALHGNLNKEGEIPG